MRHYIDTAANIRAIEPGQEFLIKPDWQELTADQLAAELEARKPKPTAESVRADRDARLTACDWVVIKAQELGQPVPQDWADYRQALRDITEQAGFPETVVWPDAPATV